MGRHVPGVDPTTLSGKVMCGYQGWFAAEGDGSDRGWVHFGAKGHFDPDHCTIDLWPDMSEMDADEKYPTAFRHGDGKNAFTFSSYNRKTVLRHFQWMQEHGIDGIFLQRFGSSVRRLNHTYNHRNVVTSHVQAGANRYGRTWAIMYDLSGLKRGEIESVVMADWKRLVDRMKIRSDKTYLHHRGKPVVAVWGVGFRGGREYGLDECETLINFLKRDSAYGGNTVMLGVPTGWRTMDRDALNDKKLHDVIKQADIVSPWTVGRYSTPESARRHARKVVEPDIAWTKERQLDYLPVVFPGFSWQNLQRIHGRKAKLDQIPRLKGEFLWAQGRAFAGSGAEMLYVAMFDEVDEATAIFKCTNYPPTSKKAHFITYEGLPSDHYLWLTGRLGALIRKEFPGSSSMPSRE